MSIMLANREEVPVGFPGAVVQQDIIAGAVDALAIAALVCDRTGRVVVASQSGEELLARREHFRLRGGRLSACSEEAARRLSEAIRATAAPQRAGKRPLMVVIEGCDGLQPLVAELTTVSLVQENGEAAPAALVVVHSPGTASGRAARLGQLLFGLTNAETSVLTELLAGNAPQTIAQRTGVSVGTVRTHLRNIFDKAGVHSQIELLARLTACL